MVENDERKNHISITLEQQQETGSYREKAEIIRITKNGHHRAEDHDFNT